MLPNALIGLQARYGRNVNTVITRNLRRSQPPPGKPPIIPPAKRVLYNAVNHEWEKPELIEGLLWRRHVYNSAVESLRKIFAEEINQKKQVGLATENLREQELEELNMRIAENEKRNEKAAEERQLRYEQEMELLKQEITEEIDRRLMEDKLFVEEKSKEVQAVIERSVEFVTRENLDQRLAEVLESPVVYDFAIDLKGHKMYAPAPVKYQTGVPTKQKGRLYDRTLGLVAAESKN